MNYQITNEIRLKLQQAIIEHGGSQTSLARAMKISKVDLSRYISGKVSFCQKENWEKITAFFFDAKKIIDECTKEITGSTHISALKWDACIIDPPDMEAVNRIKACFPLSWKMRLALCRLRHKYDNADRESDSCDGLESEIAKVEAAIKKLENKEFPDGNILSVNDCYRIVAHNTAGIEAFRQRVIDGILNLDIDSESQIKTIKLVRGLNTNKEAQ